MNTVATTGPTTSAAQQPTLSLRNGVTIPQLGLGVFRTPSGAETRRVVRDAIACGYRHIDTARVYGNEADVAEGIRESGVVRGDVFVTTKIWNDDQGYDQTLRAFDGSLARMRFDYVDLLLLHWPVPQKRLQSWRALEKLQKEGRARAIGVSNFMPHHLRELLAHCTQPPSVNQVELSPYLQQRDVCTLCNEDGIVVEAYSPLTKGARLTHPGLVRIAADVGKSPAQVLIRWGIQKRLVVLPKSTRPERLAENFQALQFHLSEEHIATLDSFEEGLVTGWDPRKAP
ncbi:MAG: aldo/keto reductase [Polyangiaceae bacterium]|nr:aldo/keto reductase [Polyangiaceae bacterium]